MDAIDIVCNLFTEREVRLGQTGLDDTFKSQIRMPEAIRGGIPIEDYLAKMDRAGIVRSLLIAVRAGDLNVRESFEIPYSRVAEVCAAHPDRFSGLAGVDPLRGHAGPARPRGGGSRPWLRRRTSLSALVRPGAGPRQILPLLRQMLRTRHSDHDAGRHSLIYSRNRRLPSVGRPICLDQVAIDFRTQAARIHIGVPWTQEMISMAWKHENVFIGVDAYAPKHWPPRSSITWTVTGVTRFSSAPTGR